MNLNRKIIEITLRAYNLTFFVNNKLPFQEISHLKKIIKRMILSKNIVFEFIKKWNY